jgi:hypothetical protein
LSHYHGAHGKAPPATASCDYERGGGQDERPTYETDEFFIAPVGPVTRKAQAGLAERAVLWRRQVSRTRAAPSSSSCRSAWSERSSGSLPAALWCRHHRHPRGRLQPLPKPRTAHHSRPGGTAAGRHPPHRALLTARATGQRGPGEGASKPRARACSTASARRCAPSFEYTLPMWVLTVVTETDSSLAISAADKWVGR